MKDVVDLLIDPRLQGGGLAGQGDSQFAGDFDQNPNCKTGRVIWQIRNKDTSDIIEMRDLQQFAKLVVGGEIHEYGTDSIFSPQGYEVPDDQTEYDQNQRCKYKKKDKVKKYGGDLTKFEAEVIPSAKGTTVVIPQRAIDNINTKFNYIEPTGQ